MIRSWACVVIICLLLTGCTQHSRQTQVTPIKLMSLNLYGWKTMPQHAEDYASLIRNQEISILVVQEGVDDWQIDTLMPTDYSRAISLLDSLGSCWQRQWQIFINHCNGVSFKQSKRFDLADGPNAVRTGEMATLNAAGQDLIVINVHWDHESLDTQITSARQVSNVIKQSNGHPTLLAGDFNRECLSAQQMIAQHIPLELAVDGGIDCIFTTGVHASGTRLDAPPSDHPAVIATIDFHSSQF